MTEIRIQKIDGQEFVPLTDYLRLKEEKQELEYLWDINQELKEENKKLKEERDNRKDEYKKAIDRENERVYNCNEYYAETMETRRKNMELKEENKKLNKDYLIAQEGIKELKRQIKWLINDSKKVWEGLIQTYKDLEHYDKEDENLS